MEKPDNEFPEIHTITYSLIIVLLPPEWKFSNLK